MSMIDWRKARSNFLLDDSIIYLNNASHGPLPVPARRVYDLYLDSWQKTAHNHDAESFKIIEAVRGKLAGIVGVDFQRIGLSTTTSYGLNIIAAGYRWSSGDNIIVSDNEFPANVYPWVRLKSRGVDIRFAKNNQGFIDEEAIISLADNKTRVINTSWVQFNNGYRADLEKLGRFCADNRIIFCVDGIQGLGAMPVELESLNVDLFTCGCQKWMLGPCGTGFYYLSERAESMIDPPFSGWLSVDWQVDFSDLMKYDLTPRKGPAKFELGTYPYQDIRALNASVDLLLSFGLPEIWDRVRRLTEQLIDILDSDKRFHLVSSRDESRRSGIVAFKNQDPMKLYRYLTDEGYILSFREGGIRVSPHFYNSEEEINLLISALDHFQG